ncbi:Pentatricopeptide repeat-containing protein [Dissostichus eleginoides]|uniref:Pentatricopeptide repeat-containing protein n=1 Tax=Dissostichus eleginoides TaxID=100907 RepID=A0AAD9B921_DISEL|nr:Pentatricopeptide repeat-containing protein [Dissostichus eleginoides]
MRVPVGWSAISCLCPLVFLCVVAHSSYGTRVDLSPNTNTNPNPSLFPYPRLKSTPEPTLLPSSSSEKSISPLNPRRS